MPDNKQKRVMIGIPCMDTLKVETVMSLFASAHSTDAAATLHIYKTSLVHDARNKIAEKAIEDGYDYLMFIDSDIRFEPTAIQKLIDQDKDIIGGLYFQKRPPHLPTLSEKKGKLLRYPRVWSKSKPFQIFGVGTGFMLIKVSVLEKLKAPYFYYGKLHEQMMGEDIYFCWKAQQSGFEVWCDPTVDIGHVGEYVYTKADYDAYQEGRPEEDVDELWSGETQL